MAVPGPWNHNDPMIPIEDRAEPLWTAEMALNDLWETLDLRTSKGALRQTLKTALQNAYSAGYRGGYSAAEYNDNSV